jgi:DnaJ-class molecular chaperone
VLIAHPDKQNGQNEDFQRLQQAKDILTDPSKRKHYDLYLSVGSDMPLNEWMQHRERLPGLSFD